MHVKEWSVAIYIDEHEDRTRARATLHNPDETGLVGVGRAKRNPVDQNVPEIGDELAVSRAMADLAHQLLDAAASDIESITKQSAHLVE